MDPDEVLGAMQTHCLAKEGAFEDYPWEHVVWKLGKKIFVMASEGSAVFTIKSTPPRQEELVHHPRIERAAYVGRFGWVTMTVETADDLELAMSLADEAYESVRPKGKRRE
jgi:predicted DNA-binding protein (MmcQ/YjbR family)